MRVWLIDDRPGHDPEGLESPLRQLSARSAGSLELLATGPFSPEKLTEARGRKVEVIVLCESAWPEGPWLEELLALDAALVVATPHEANERFLSLAERHPVSLISPRTTPDELRRALWGALAGQRRQAYWKGEVHRLTQRLNDRIVIERAKGILVQRLGIDEEAAYERLRVQARRQRRQLRDIAQSVVDTQLLMLPGSESLPEHTVVESPREPDN
jgi:hypothetical protein